MAYYSKGINVNEIVNNGQGNDIDGSITGYKGFPISDPCPDSYSFERIPQPLGYGKDGVDFAQTSNGTSNCNVYSIFFDSSSNLDVAQTVDVTNYNYLSCVLIGGGGGGGGGFGGNNPGAGGGGAAAGAFYKVDISTYNTISVKVGSGGPGDNAATNNYAPSGKVSVLYLGDSNSTYYIKANGGSGGKSGAPSSGDSGGGSHGNFGTNTVTSGTAYNFNGSNNGGNGGGNNGNGGDGGNVGNWTTPLANYTSGTGGAGGDYQQNAASPGNLYGGGGGGGYGENGGSNNLRKGAAGAQGYVEIWLYKD